MEIVNYLEEKFTAAFEESNLKKLSELESVAKGERKLNLAQRLTLALGSENGRWEENVTFLNQNKSKLLGDVRAHLFHM
jgi:dynein heavy chain